MTVRRVLLPGVRLASLLLPLLWMSPAAASAWGLQEMMDAMASVRSERAYFEERKSLSVLQEAIHTRGVLAYRAPDYMLKETLTPFVETLEVNGDWLRIDAAETKQRVHLPSYPLLLALVEAVRATMAGDLDRLRQLYAITFTGDANAWSLSLDPLAADAREHLARTTIEGSGNRIVRVETLEADGDRSVMTVTVFELQ